MTAFESFEQFEMYADEILDLVRDSTRSISVSHKVLEAVENASESRNSGSNSVSLNLGDTIRIEESNQVRFVCKLIKCHIRAEAVPKFLIFFRKLNLFIF